MAVLCEYTTRQQEGHDLVVSTQETVCALEDEGDVPSSQWLTGHKKTDGWCFHWEVISNMTEFTLVVEMRDGGKKPTSKCSWKCREHEEEETSLEGL